MTDPMTEGAKTGTPREFRLGNCSRGFPIWEAIGKGLGSSEVIIVREVLDNDPLTEALKVAGEALDAAEEWLSEERGSNGILGTIAEAREKLERIRNNKH